MAKPMKTLELHYPMIQFLTIDNRPEVKYERQVYKVSTNKWRDVASTERQLGHFKKSPFKKERSAGSGWWI